MHCSTAVMQLQSVRRHANMKCLQKVGYVVRVHEGAISWILQDDLKTT
jgi:hypothetical protein